MKIEDIKKNKKILIVGYGVEGHAAEKFLKKYVPDAEIGIVDQKDGAGYLDRQKDYDLAIKSPGVKSELIQISYTTLTNIFLSNAKGKAIGVTGTKGKGTTSSLIYEMLKKEGVDAYLGGNIGEPAVNFLDKLDTHSWTVLELSSFQLKDLKKSPHIAVVLMITSDHLDHHKDLSEYIDAKRNILRFQTADDFAIVNRDYPASNESDIETQGKVFYVSRERETDNGCFVIGGKVIVRKNGSDNEIGDTKEILLPGKHNYENVCAAVMAANTVGVSTKNIISVLKSFKGLEHRLELVREIGGVKYYDDSFSTTPETAIAAIEAFNSPEILILGGSGVRKNDFSDLGRVVREAKNIKAIIGIGDEWHEIKSKIQDPRSKILIIEDATDMKTVVSAAAKVARSGDVVILTPGCVSFGMFANYKDRGEQFKREVLALS